MRDFLVWSFAFLAAWAAIMAVGFIVLRWRLQRANRVSPAVRSPAPTRWLWAPGRPARLHRRLRVATREIQLAPASRHRPVDRLSVDDLRRELEAQAVEIDHHVVVAARHPRPYRRALLRQLDGQVSQVEHLSLRLSTLSRLPGTPASGWDQAEPPEALGRITAQLDALDAAKAELEQIERAAGLVDADALLAPISPRPAVSPRTPPPPGPTHR